MPVAVPAGIVKPQYVGWEIFAVLVGDVRKKPETVTALAVSAVLVPANVKLDVEYRCELVAIELEPEVSVTDALS